MEVDLLGRDAVDAALGVGEEGERAHGVRDALRREPLGLPKDCQDIGEGAMGVGLRVRFVGPVDVRVSGSLVLAMVNVLLVLPLVIVPVVVLVSVAMLVSALVFVLVLVRMRVALGDRLLPSRQQHVDLRRGERPLPDAPRRDPHAGKAERVDDFLERGDGEPRVDEGPEEHVARDARGHVEERDRASRAHGLPAPDATPTAA